MSDSSGSSMPWAQPATDAMVSDAPTACKFCGDATRTFNSHRDGITFECGARVLWHDPPHGKGWSWWTRPATCKRIGALQDAMRRCLDLCSERGNTSDDRFLHDLLANVEAEVWNVGVTREG